MTSSTINLWFLIFESVISDQYFLAHKTHTNFISSNPRLKSILSLIHVQGDEKDFSFWLHSGSMPAAVQLLSDESILTTWELYCQADQVITIYVRERKDPSPNASRAVSHALSLEQRRKVSQAEPAEIELRTPLRHNTCQSSDVLSRDPVRRLPTNDQVVLDLGRGKTETFSKDYLRGIIFSLVIQEIPQNERLI